MNLNSLESIYSFLKDICCIINDGGGSKYELLASSLTCVECNVEGEKYCQGNKVTCPPEEDVCVTTLESDTKDGKEMVTFRRHCGQRRMCGYSDSLTTAFGKKKLSSTCCFTSDCSPPSPTFPAGKTDKNGVFCKSCDTERGLSCESSSTMECTGNENKCVLMTNVMTEGYALSCTRCSSASSTTCSGDSVICPSGFQCGSTYAESTSGGKTSTSFTRGCVPESECNFQGNVNVNEAKLETAYTCCSTDNCNPPVPKILSSSSATNGLVCPSCESDSVSKCDSSATVTCIGNNNKCIFTTTNITAGQTSLLSITKGCATESFCVLGNHSYTIEGATTNITIVCSSGQTTTATPTSIQTTAATPTSIQTTAATPVRVENAANYPMCPSGGISVQKIVLTPAVVCLLLLKWLF
ncbi:urokinase plasminogen activator surface receptor-like [Bufo gargarizans]|uniref:urokinase plasminogen activator surface receptor-like n=1 Tax=Bufo gargarizans TaxID=30331 RepID=UPI001CF3C3CA|nr:urokinase plasminogen activator surface receptor-like [Bufo gargarizans]